ncbi:MAG: hypothetical protein WD988_04240 [Candidatus Curtissbacteria bacterium]
MIKRKETKINYIEETSTKVTNWIGTPWSIIAHTFFFVLIFGLRIFGLGTDQILLILTTAVSLEAIYLAIFIQMTVNRNTEALEAVEDDIEDIQEDVEDISEDIEADDTEDRVTKATLSTISRDLKKLQEDIASIRSREK